MGNSYLPPPPFVLMESPPPLMYCSHLLLIHSEVLFILYKFYFENKN
jgi:hypothetical protein